MFTPHARGSTLSPCSAMINIVVYPACAGIDLGSCLCRSSCGCLPRMRGDRPHYTGYYCDLHQFTPHARGSTYGLCRTACSVYVYPACAGIDPVTFADLYHALRLPRMRGDRPQNASDFWRDAVFTPHARGSTLRRMAGAHSAGVYPACAGIDLRLYQLFARHIGLPRMRGDRPCITFIAKRRE